MDGVFLMSLLPPVVDSGSCIPSVLGPLSEAMKWE